MQIVLMCETAYLAGECPGHVIRLPHILKNHPLHIIRLPRPLTYDLHTVSITVVWQLHQILYPNWRK